MPTVTSATSPIPATAAPIFPVAALSIRAAPFPVNCEVGPDGALYVADWCDKRASHVDPLDTWDRSKGRIYKVQHRGALPGISSQTGGSQPAFDLNRFSSKKLVELLSHT